MSVIIESSWKELLKDEFSLPYWEKLATLVKEDYQKYPCFPKGGDIFKACNLTPVDAVKVVILWQDPYHTPGAAMGLCFSVPKGSKSQPSLQNIFKELSFDCWIERSSSDLSDWAEQWVLLLNSVLTVRAHAPGSHKAFGWETFTDAIIRNLSLSKKHLVFMLWGNYAITKRSLIDEKKHCILCSAHPSPFSAHKGFFWSRPFSQGNSYLTSTGQTPIFWGEKH